MVTNFTLLYFTHVILELTKYCIEEMKMTYVLPSKLQMRLLSRKVWPVLKISWGLI